MFAELLNRVAPVRALGNDQHVRLAGDEGLDSSAQQRMIIDGENPNGFGTGAHECACRRPAKDQKSRRIRGDA
jgi:hypothetical protein